MKKPMQIEFDAAEHKYKLNGNPVPSVTQILTDVLGEPYQQTDKEWYLQRGRAAHAAYALLAQGKKIEVDPALDGYVKGWEAWQTNTHPHFEMIEFMVAHPLYQYAGTLDAFIGPTLEIIDYKSATSLRTPLQLAAYVLAFEQMSGRMVRHGQEIEIKDDGTYKVKIYNLDQYKREWLAILSVYNIKRRVNA